MSTAVIHDEFNIIHNSIMCYHMNFFSYVVDDGCGQIFSSKNYENIFHHFWLHIRNIFWSHYFLLKKNKKKQCVALYFIHTFSKWCMCILFYSIVVLNMIGVEQHDHVSWLVHLPIKGPVESESYTVIANGWKESSFRK